MQRTFAKVCGLTSEVFKTKAIDFDPPGTLDPSEEDWVTYIPGPPQNITRTPRQASKQQDWQLRLDNINFSSWQRQQHSYFLLFDGAATRNPGVEGVGGVIYDSEGKTLTDYAWGLGKMSNKKEETLAAYMRLELAQDLCIQTLTVLWDSEIVIKELGGMPRSEKTPLQSISTAINSLKKKSVRLSFFHIL
jgi:hypothetical protein